MQDSILWLGSEAECRRIARLLGTALTIMWEDDFGIMQFCPVEPAGPANPDLFRIDISKLNKSQQARARTFVRGVAWGLDPSLATLNRYQRKQ